MRYMASSVVPIYPGFPVWFEALTGCPAPGICGKSTVSAATSGNDLQASKKGRLQRSEHQVAAAGSIRLFFKPISGRVFVPVRLLGARVLARRELLLAFFDRRRGRFGCLEIGPGEKSLALLRGRARAPFSCWRRASL